MWVYPVDMILTGLPGGGPAEMLWQSEFLDLFRVRLLRVFARMSGHECRILTRRYLAGGVQREEGNWVAHVRVPAAECKDSILRIAASAGVKGHCRCSFRLEPCAVVRSWQAS